MGKYKKQLKINNVKMFPIYLITCLASNGLCSDEKCHCAGIRRCPYYCGYNMTTMSILCSYPIEQKPNTKFRKDATK